jgi:hypothetical protein
VQGKARSPRRQPGGTRVPLAVCALLLFAGAATPTQAPTEQPRVTWQTLPSTDLVPNPASWAIVPAKEGEIKRGYNDLTNTTEVWMKLTPAIDGPGDNPTTLYFSAVFRGRTLKTTPDRVWLRARSDLMIQSNRLRTPTLSVTASGQVVLSVVDPPLGAAAWLNYPCPLDGDIPCSFDGMVAAIPIVSFFRMLDADRVSGEALGISFTLSLDQVRRLAELAKELVPATY